MRRAVQLMAPYRRPIRDGLVVAGLVYLAYQFVVLAPIEGTVGGDAFAYWNLDPTHPYGQPNGEIGAFLYPPPMVRAFAPFALLSWPQFWLLWTGVLVATCILARLAPGAPRVRAPARGARAAVREPEPAHRRRDCPGFRFPAAWAFVLLTKVTQGVGLLWFAARREWRHLAVALGLTAVIVGVSIVVDGRTVDRVVRGAGSRCRRHRWAARSRARCWLRLPIAAVLVLWGARTVIDPGPSRGGHPRDAVMWPARSPSSPAGCDQSPCIAAEDGPEPTLGLGQAESRGIATGRRPRRSKSSTNRRRNS